MSSSKEIILKFMHATGFDHISDIKYEHSHEWYAVKNIDTGEPVWFPIESCGSGFNYLFKSAIKEACDE